MYRYHLLHIYLSNKYIYTYREICMHFYRKVEALYIFYVMVGNCMSFKGALYLVCV